MSMASDPTQVLIQKPHDIKLSPGLYVVATPIGNIRDITLRALDVLIGADCIFCEDTRITGKLLKIYSISTPMKSYHDHSGEAVRDHIVKRVEKGESLALVSDAGTPLISDPGYKLLRIASEENIPIHVVPGPCAAIAGLVCSAMPTDQFCFLGFLPTKAAAKKHKLEEWNSVSAPLIIYERASRLLKTLQDIQDVLGNRRVAVARELTKLYEEVRSDQVEDLIHHYEEQGLPKGELVLVIEGAAEIEYDQSSIDNLLQDLLKTHSVKDASQSVAILSGWGKKDVYERALLLSKNDTV